MMDNWVDNTLVKLKIIAKLSENDKLCFRENGVNLDPPRQIRFFIRTFYGDSRNLTIKNLQELYSTVFVVMSKYVNELSSTPKSGRSYDHNSPGIYSNETFKMFYEEIENSLKGITNLTVTYKSDIEFNAQLETLTTKIKNNLNDFYSEYSVIQERKRKTTEPIEIPPKNIQYDE